MYVSFASENGSMIWTVYLWCENERKIESERFVFNADVGVSFETLKPIQPD